MLHTINLLPWRETQRENYRQHFIHLLILGVLLALGAQWLAGSYFEQQNQQQQGRLDFLNQHIRQLDQRLNALKVTEQEHKALLTRLNVVEALQQKRNKSTEFMHLMPDLIPEGVYVDKIKMNGQEVEMSGISDSTARLATMLDNLEKSPQLSEVGMHSIVSGNRRFGKQFQSFKVSFLFHASEQVALKPVKEVGTHD
ncbi:MULTISPECIES: PilN domain-containing protein [unclassified Vibrio]|uniref:PilN domain-containing protein n=3 Tax=Vibrio TaxID=662 RepID=UPI001372F341|nr:MULTISPECIES: PilN domain-containing protein [unclassified Vibrio]NAW67896.1 pilus assembly protein PilN [Vibrio sp. V28_P6S34P95]NAX05903.1 pilus assembly protein PilN [Vibrio sp. V30_P3S12P165]NAX34712.1 pilus assembly protein PilN [Vibrio sp. V29_P1S30P107]NAX36659.1 pilus assembly protein PilN [Vibrio sp. V27_P1S3P104]NAX40576.1 pilus assembly protein PilN [Vibrio sp. V26_P1S5P106]